MARRIKETPILTGKDARRFDKAVEEKKSKKVPSSEYERAKKIYDRVMASSKLA